MLHLNQWKSYAGGSEAVSHDEVEGGAGLASSAVKAAATVLEHLLAQISTLLSFFFKQQVPKLEHTRQATSHMTCPLSSTKPQLQHSRLA